MTRRRCCCGCFHFTDEFSRVTLGDDWDALSGTWLVTGTEMITSSSDAIIICEDTEGPTDEDMVMEVTLKGLDSQEQVILIGNYVDSSNYYFAKIQFGLNPHGWMEVWQRVAGSNTRLGYILHETEIPAEESTWRLCISRSPLAVTVYKPASAMALTGLPEDTLTATSQFGLGTGTITGVQFDDFKLGQQQDGTACLCGWNLECPGPGGSEGCGGLPIAWIMDVGLGGLTDATPSGNCAWCVDIIDLWVLDYGVSVGIGSCGYSFVDEDNYDCSEAPKVNVQLAMGVNFNSDGVNQWWEACFVLYRMFLGVPNEVFRQTWDSTHIADDPGRDCVEDHIDANGDIELTKASLVKNTAYAVCDDELPETIYITPIPPGEAFR